MNREFHHHHHHAPPDYNRAFAVGVGLNIVFVVVEVVYGLLANSLALLTDAGHNLSDVLGLLLAWGANALASRKPSLRLTYGYSRATILASLASGLLLLAAVVTLKLQMVGRSVGKPQKAGGRVGRFIAVSTSNLQRLTCSSTFLDIWNLTIIHTCDIAYHDALYHSGTLPLSIMLINIAYSLQSQRTFARFEKTETADNRLEFIYFQ